MSHPLDHQDHRPWPIPSGPWVMAMQWHQLLFAHWPMPAADLRPHLPAGLELDTFEGQAWLGVVPFVMRGTRPRCVPPVPGLSDFPELNLRTYVSAQGKPGVWFFSLDAASRFAVRAARWSFGLPYFDARMSVKQEGGEVVYRSERTHRGAVPASFRGRYGPVGEVFTAQAGSLEHWLTERYALYSVDRKGRLCRGNVHHVPWPLQRAQAEFEQLHMTELVGRPLPQVPPLLHFARRIDVVAWLARPI